MEINREFAEDTRSAASRWWRAPAAIWRAWRATWLVWTLAALVLSGMEILPRAIDAARIFVLRGDPVVRAEYQLESVAPDAYEDHIRGALADDDPELAASLLVLARQRNVHISPDLAESVEAVSGFDALRVSRNVWKGVATGRADSTEGFVAAIVADMTAVGDARDFVGEIRKYPDYDPFMLCLSGAGLGLTAMTYTSLGGALPARIGASTLKAAKKLGKLPKPLLDELLAQARRAIDSEALRALARRTGSLDVAGAKAAAGRIVRPAAIGRINEATGTIGAIGYRRGYRATLQTLDAASSTADLLRLRKLSQKFGDGYRALLKLLPKAGKGLFKLGRFLAKLMMWILSGVIWAMTTAYVTGRIVLFAARRVKRSAKAA